MGIDVRNGDINDGNGKRRRLSGRLGHGPRGLNILTDTGDLWVLDNDEVNMDLIGQMVTAEGVTVGYDRLKVEWIGEAQR